MDCFGDEFLACATLTIDEHSCVRWCHTIDHLADVLHRLALAHDIVELVPRTQLRLQINVLGQRLGEFEGPLNRNEQFVHLEGLSHVVKCAQLEGLDRGLNGRIGREHEH